MESQTCKTCGTSTLILVRSIENTFYCGKCRRWVPCDPAEAREVLANALRERFGGRPVIASEVSAWFLEHVNLSERFRRFRVSLQVTPDSADPSRLVLEVDAAFSDILSEMIGEVPDDSPEITLEFRVSGSSSGAK